MQKGPILLHTEHIFPKVEHFSRLVCYFCNINFIMKHFLKKYTVIYILFLLFSLTARSQDSRLENLVVTAVERMDSNDFDGAETILEKVIGEDDSNDAAWYYLSKIAIAGKDLDKAETCLKKAMAADPGNFWYRHTLARLFSMTDRPELAISMYEELLEDFPEKSDLYFDLVEFYASQRELDKALAILKDIETEFGMTESIAVYRFNLLRMMDRQEEAYESLREYNSRYSSPFVLSTLAEYEMSMYNDSTALKYYDEALDIVPDYSPALLGKAEAYRVTMKYDDYFRTLYRYIGSADARLEEKVDYVMAVMQRTGVKFLKTFQPQLDTAMVMLQEAHPDDSTSLRTSAVYFYSTDRQDKAGELFLRNMQLHPGNYSAHADYVEYLLYTDRWKELSEQGRKSFESFPEETAFLEMAGVGDYNLGDYEKVLDMCRKVIETAPADSAKCIRSYSTMGDVYHRLGQNKNAYKAYEKALKINPDYNYVLNNYAYFLSEDGKKLKKACAMSRKTIEAEPDNATYLDTYAWILYLMGKADEAKPLFKRAMLYGGKDSPVILHHYAEVLYELEEYDMAFIYWNMALQKNRDEIPGLEEKVKQKRQAAKK